MGLFDLFSNSTARDAANEANAQRVYANNTLAALYGQGRDALTSNTDKAAGIYSDLAGKFQPGFDAYGDASGANGAEGLARATANFQNSGQYGVYGVANDAAQQALQRAHAASGNLSSGNTDVDAMTKAASLAQTGWGQYQTGLQPYLADYSNAKGNQAALYPALGNQLNASDMALGNAIANNQVAMGQNTAGATLNNYKVAGNDLGALMGVASLAAGGVGGLGGLGAIGSSLSSGLFGGLTGGQYGGTASNPLPGLSASDYGPGAGLFDTFGVG